MPKEAKEKTELQIKMDAAAQDAAKELKKLPKDAIKAVGAWMVANRSKAGLKRLGRVLIEAAQPAAKSTDKEKED